MEVVSFDSAATHLDFGRSDLPGRQHLDGINRSRLGRREGIGAATVERYFQRGLQRQLARYF
jgi:hypothetical protein